VLHTSPVMCRLSKIQPRTVCVLPFITCWSSTSALALKYGSIINISALFWAWFLVFSHFFLVFTARCYACAVLAMGLCLSVTSRCSTKTAKHRITQTTSHDSPESPVFWHQRSPRNSTRVSKCSAMGQNWRLSANLYLSIKSISRKWYKIDT